MTDFIIEHLKSEIECFRKNLKAEKTGRVTEVGDGIARIYGLSNAASQEMLEFETESGVVNGIAFNLEEESVGAIILGNSTKIAEGDHVKTTGRVLSIR